MILDYGAQCNHKGFFLELSRRTGVRDTHETMQKIHGCRRKKRGVQMFALKMKQGTMSQGIPLASRS